MEPEVVTPRDRDTDESTPGLERAMLFETETAVMVQSRVSGNTTSGWHHHGDRAVFGYIKSGTAHLDYGPVDDPIKIVAGQAFHIPAGTVHRDRNPLDSEQVAIACFVGTGPMVVNADPPDSA